MHAFRQTIVATMLMLGFNIMALASGDLAQAFTFTTIAVPDATETYAYGINAAGQIVGFYVDDQGNIHGFVAP